MKIKYLFLLLCLYNLNVFCAQQNNEIPKDIKRAQNNYLAYKYTAAILLATGMGISIFTRNYCPEVNQLGDFCDQLNTAEPMIYAGSVFWGIISGAWLWERNNKIHEQL